MNQTERATIDLVINGQAAKASLTDIEKSVRSFRNEIKKMREDDDPDLYAKKVAEFKKLNATYQQMNGNIREVTTSWQKFKKEMATVATGVLGGNIMTAVFEKALEFIPNMIAKAAELSDSFANIQKTTGMSSREVANFNKELSKIDTRTKTKDLREIAIVAGQLGIAKNDILGFTKSVDTLNIALGDEFSGGAAEVADITGKLRNIFSDIKSDKIDVDLLHIGNAINELGASGAATGPVVADFANRIGGVGITLGLTSGQVLGLSATLQELNVSTERGGTAVTKILQRMLTDSGAFANVAGMEINKFKDLLNTDLYGAFVQVAKGAGATKEKGTEFAKTLESMGIEGAGAMEVFSKLSENTDLLKNRVDMASEALQNQNSILAEASLKNNNLAANLEKLGKIMNATWQSSAIMNFLSSLIGALADTRSEAQKLTDQYREQKNEFDSLEKKINPLVATYEELKGKTSLNKVESAKLKDVIKQLGQEMPMAITMMDKYGNATQISTEKIKEMLSAEKARLEYVNKEQIAKNEILIKDLEGRNAARLKMMRGRTTAEIVDARSGALQLRNLSNEELKELKAQYDETARTIKGIRAQVAIDKGDNLGVNIVKNKVEKTVTSFETTGNKDDKGKIETLKKEQNKLAEEIEKAEYENHLNTLNAREKELAVLKSKYDKMREMAKGNTADLLSIANVEAVELTNITKKWADEDSKIVAENSAKKQKAYEDAQAKLHQQNLNEIALKEARGELTPEGAEDLKLVKEQEYLQAQFIMRWGMGLQTADLEKQLADNFISQEQRKRDYAVNADRAVKESRAQLLDAQITGMRAAGSFLSAAFKDQKGLAKAMFLADRAAAASQVLMQGFRERAALRAANALQVAAASATGIGVLAVPGIKLAGELQLARSRTETFTAIAGIGAATIQEFAKGSYTKAAYSNNTSGGYVPGPTIFNGKYIAGEAGGEWMASNATLSNPVAANIIGALDALQKTGQMGSLNNIANSTDTGVGANAASADVMEMKAMMAQMMNAIQQVDSKPVHLPLTMLEEEQAKLVNVRGF